MDAVGHQVFDGIIHKPMASNFGLAIKGLAHNDEVEMATAASRACMTFVRLRLVPEFQGAGCEGSPKAPLDFFGQIHGGSCGWKRLM